MGSTCAVCSCDSDGSNTDNSTSTNIQKRRASNPPSPTIHISSNSKSSQPKIINTNLQPINTRNVSNKSQITSTNNTASNPHIFGLHGVDTKTLSLLLKMDPISPMYNNINPSDYMDPTTETSYLMNKQVSTPKIIISQIPSIPHPHPIPKSHNQTNTAPLQLLEMMKKYDCKGSITDESSYSDTEMLEIQQRKQLISKSKSKSMTLSPFHKRRTSHLLTSNEEWESEDMDDLEHDMKKELQHLKSFENIYTPKYKENSESTDNNIDIMDEDDMNEMDMLNTPASLFRLKSADKWNKKHIDVQKEQMKKHMLHLASNRNVNLGF